jgi:6-phosphogluconate dehydrogenase
MKLGVAGLGKMGANIARRLAAGGHDVVGFDQSRDVTLMLERERIITFAEDVDDLTGQLAPPRCVWGMLPAGEPTGKFIDRCARLLEAGDLLIDGANSNYRDSLQRAAMLADRGIGFLDIGVSGGVWGLEKGYGLMVGGIEAHVERVRPLLESLAPAPDRGWVHCGPAGAGHYAKMVHNAIEYGMMQSIAEGLGLLRAADEFEPDLAAIAESWRHGSVIRSWLLDLTAGFLAEDPKLASIAPQVDDSGEGRWALIDAIERGVPTPAISAALNARFTSRGLDDYSARVLAAMRKAFGGHATGEG